MKSQLHRQLTPQPKQRIVRLAHLDALHCHAHNTQKTLYAMMTQAVRIRHVPVMLNAMQHPARMDLTTATCVLTLSVLTALITQHANQVSVTQVLKTMPIIIVNARQASQEQSTIEMRNARVATRIVIHVPLVAFHRTLIALSVTGPIKRKLKLTRALCIVWITAQRLIVTTVDYAKQMVLTYCMMVTSPLHLAAHSLRQMGLQ